MNASRIVRRSLLLSRQLGSKSGNNALIPRRLLISSAETGGTAPLKPNRRISSTAKLLALGGFSVTSILTYLSFVKEDEINAALGLNWNTGLVGTVMECTVGLPLLYIVLSPTLAL